MKYISNINNVKCLEWGITANQGALMDLLCELSSWAETEIVNNEVYYFISRGKVIKEIPTFFQKDDTVYRNFKDLKAKGLILYMKKSGKDLVKLTTKGKEYNYEKGVQIEKENNSDLNPNPLGSQSESTDSDLNPTYKDIITKEDNIVSRDKTKTESIPDKKEIYLFNLKDLLRKKDKLLRNAIDKTSVSREEFIESFVEWCYSEGKNFNSRGSGLEQLLSTHVRYLNENGIDATRIETTHEEELQIAKIIVASCNEKWPKYTTYPNRKAKGPEWIDREVNAVKEGLLKKWWTREKLEFMIYVFTIRRRPDFRYCWQDYCATASDGPYLNIFKENFETALEIYKTSKTIPEIDGWERN